MGDTDVLSSLAEQISAILGGYRWLGHVVGYNLRINTRKMQGK